MTKKAMAACLINEALGLLKSDGTGGWGVLQIEDGAHRLYKDGLSEEEQYQIFSRPHDLSWLEGLRDMRES